MFKKKQWAGAATFSRKRDASQPGTPCEAILKKWPKSVPVDQDCWEKVEGNGARACRGKKKGQARGPAPF
jgi:hypothetical protein